MEHDWGRGQRAFGGVRGDGAGEGQGQIMKALEL